LDKFEPQRPVGVLFPIDVSLLWTWVGHTWVHPWGTDW